MKRLAIPFLFLVSCAVAFGGDVLFSESFENGLSDWKPFKRIPFDAWKVEKGIGRPVGVACPPTTCLVWERKADDPEPYDLRVRFRSLVFPDFLPDRGKQVTSLEL